MLPDLVFLFSSELENPDRFFQGYFFHGTDYVFGQAGFEAFSRARGLERLVREDGCYVQVEKQHGEYRFSADYNGYKKLFYFWDSGFWAVSNSLRQISLHLRKHGYPVVPDASQVAAMAAEGKYYPSGRGSFFSQLASFATIVRGVRLVPADCAIAIGPSGARIERTVCGSSDATYQDQLGHFLSTWAGRLSALVNAPSVRLMCDLTGGIDSRAVFAMVLGALNGPDTNINDRLTILSGGRGFRARRDRAVAARVCGRFGCSLNSKLPKNTTWLNGSASYGLWKDLCLGVYHPIYFPNVIPSGDLVHLRGGGGENHRPFYGRFFGAPSPERFVAKRTRDIKPTNARPDFAKSLQQAIDCIAHDPPQNLDALASHYRHFRNRFHAGLHSQYAVTVQPLASKLLDCVTAAAGVARFKRAQVLYDILHNLRPEMLELPFDSRRKRPSRDVRENFMAATAYPQQSGVCFLGHSPSRGRRKRRERSVTAIEQLNDEFYHAKNGCPVRLLGSAYVRRAERALAAAVRKGGFSGPIESKRVAVVMACAMFDF